VFFLHFQVSIHDAAMADTDTLRSEVRALLLEDVELLISEMELLLPLAGPLHRRHNMNIWNEMEQFRNEIALSGRYRNGEFVAAGLPPIISVFSILEE